MINYEEIGKRIKEKRDILKISQEALAQKMGKSKGTIQHLEAGDHKGTFEIIIECCKILNTSADYLLFGEKDKNQPLDERFSYLNADELEQIEFLLNRAKKRHDDQEKYDKVGNL